MDSEDKQVEENAPEEYYIYLDFNGKLSLDIFNKEVFIRIANLHKKSPLVQVNDSVFKGTFEHPMGTNLFFKTSEDPSQVNDAFMKRGPVQLDCVLAESKILNLKQVKIPTREIKIPRELCKIEYNLNWDYNTLLKKFADGTLQIEDIVKKKIQNEVLVFDDDVKGDIENEHNEHKSHEEKMDIVYGELVQELAEEDPEHHPLQKQLEEEYNKLKILAMKPMKQVILEESMEHSEEKYNKAFEYHNLKCQVLKPCDFFRLEPVKNIDEKSEKTLSNYADINRCVIYGLLPKFSKYPRELCDEERNNILNLENFDNLSLAARYYVLSRQIKDMEKYLCTLTETDACREDEYGRTPSETLEIYRKLKGDVRKRIEDIKVSLGEEVQKELEEVPTLEGLVSSGSKCLT